MFFVELICSVFSTMFEIWLLHDFFHGFLKYRKGFEYKWHYFVGFLILFSLFMSRFAHNGIIILTGIAIQLLFIFVVFEGNFQQKVYYWFFLWLLMFAMEYLFTILVQLKYKEFAGRMFDSKMAMFISVLIVKIVSYIVYLLVKRKIHIVPHYMDRQTFFLYMLLPISTLGILLSVVYVSDNIYKETAGNLVLALFSALAFLVDLLLYFVFNRYATLMGQSRQQECQLLRLNALQDNYENLEEINKHYGEMLHNMKHYLLLIGSYADENKNQDILKILEEMQIEISAYKNTTYCKNKLFNWILLEWKKKAENTGSFFEIKNDPEFELPPMKEMDMFGMFGNLFDNAVEAARNARKGIVNVELLMRRDGAIAIVIISNTYDGNLKICDGKIQTRKSNKMLHGIGLESAKNIAKKYNGIFQIEMERELFKITIVFHL